MKKIACPRCHKEDEWIEYEEHLLTSWCHPCGLRLETVAIANRSQSNESRIVIFQLNLDKFQLYWHPDETFAGIYTKKWIEEPDGSLHKQKLPIKDLPINITWERLKILLPFM